VSNKIDDQLEILAENSTDIQGLGNFSTLSNLNFTANAAPVRVFFTFFAPCKNTNFFCSTKAYIRSSVLSLAAISVFLRLGLVLKFCLLATVTASHVFVYVVLCAAQFKQHYLSLEQG
jgi:hypothetical protein